MPNDSGEQVTLILPSGKKQAFLIPSGMSDNEAKLYVRSKRPDLFQSPESQAPDALAQARQVISRIGPQTTERAMQQTMGGPPMFTDVPKGEKKSFEESGQKGYAAGAKVGMALPIVPAGIAAPVATALAAGGGLAGSAIGGYAAKKGAEALGASPYTQETAEDVGGVVGGAAGGLAGGKLGVGKFGKSLGASKSFGGKMLELAEAKGGDAPIELSPRTDEVIDQITQQGGLGGKTPKVVTDLLRRLGPAPGQAPEANPGPLTYKEARIIQKQLGSMSVNEKNDLSGDLQWLIPKFAKLFSADVQAGADKAGIGDIHRIGMMETAGAYARNRAVAKAAKIAGIGGGTIAGIYELMQALRGQR